MKKILLALFILTGLSSFSDSTIKDNQEVLNKISTSSVAKIVSGYKMAKEGVQTIFTYNENSMYTIYARVNYLTAIFLQPNEKILFVGGGDTARWRRANSTTGSSEGEREVIYIKPTSIDLKTNLIINTNKRTYQINLISDKSLYNPSVKWQYPDDELLEQVAKDEYLRKLERNQEKIVDPTALNYNYVLNTNKYNFAPSQVFDDGVKTYIILKEDLQEMPVLYILEGKDKLLVNYRIKGRNLIVDRLFNEAELRIEKKAVKIRRK